MKKNLGIVPVLGFIILAACSSSGKFATDEGITYSYKIYDYPYKNYKYTAIAVNGMKGKKTDVVISFFERAPVVIRENAFALKKLRTVALQGNIIEIQHGAFRDNKLTHITLPESLIAIGTDAFLGNNITSITVPENLTFVGKNALPNLTTIVVPHRMDIKVAKMFPKSFMAWYIIHGCQTGTYTFENNVWLRDGNPPPSNNTYATITAVGSTFIKSVDGNAGVNYHVSKQGGLFTTDTYILPPGFYEIGFLSSKEKVSSDVGYCVIYLNAGRRYKATFRGFFAGPRIVLGRNKEGRAASVTYYISEVE
jgi:hypothetical protein